MTLSVAQVAMLSGAVACAAFLLEVLRPLRGNRGVRGNSYPVPVAAVAFTAVFIVLYMMGVTVE